MATVNLEKKAETRENRMRRVQFDFAQEAYEELTQLQSQLDANTKAETVRTALRTLKWLLEVLGKDQRILVDDGQKVQQVIFPFWSARPTKNEKDLEEQVMA